MLRQVPPPVFKYDVTDMKGLERQLSHWPEKRQLPDIELKQVAAGQNAIYQLPDLLASLGVTAEYEVILVMDAMPYKRDDAEVKTLVENLLTQSGFRVHRVVLNADEYGLVHPDFSAIDQVKPHLHEKCAVLSVGSGVVTDVSKHSCYLWKQEHPESPNIPLIACMTACSVPAYASRSSIISRNGAKRTWPSRLPDIVVMDYKILRDCPQEITVAGVGDMFPVFCSYGDWYLADVFGMADFLDGSWRILEDAKTLLVSYSEGIAKGELTAIEVLAKCLTLCGLAMTYARDSVPVSGYEHVMSHLIDMSAACDQRATGLHGQQVGVSILFSLAQYELLFDYLDQNHDKISLDGCYPEAEEVKKQVLEIYHELDPSDAMGMECWNDVAIKLENWKQARPKVEEFLKNWPQYREILKTLVPKTAKECAKALHRSGHPLLPGEMKIPVSEKRMRWALKNARFQRKRFTSADLAGFLGLYDQAWEDAVVQKVKEAALTD